MAKIVNDTSAEEMLLAPRARDRIDQLIGEEKKKKHRDKSRVKVKDLCICFCWRRLTVSLNDFEDPDIPREEKTYSR